MNGKLLASHKKIIEIHNILLYNTKKMDDNRLAGPFMPADFLPL